jgi:hypothetical protein
MTSTATDSVRHSALGPTIADLSLLSLSRRPYSIGGVSRSRPGGSGAGVGEQAFYGLADLVQQPAGGVELASEQLGVARLAAGRLLRVQPVEHPLAHQR